MRDRRCADAPEALWLPSQDIFGLLLWVFRKLENASAPSFQRYVSILDTVSQVRSARRSSQLAPAEHLPMSRQLGHNQPAAEAFANMQTRCGVLALDFEGDDYTCDLFSVLLDVAKCVQRACKPGLSFHLFCVDSCDALLTSWLRRSEDNLPAIEEPVLQARSNTPFFERLGMLPQCILRTYQVLQRIIKRVLLCSCWARCWRRATRCRSGCWTSSWAACWPPRRTTSRPHTSVPRDMRPALWHPRRPVNCVHTVGAHF